MQYLFLVLNINDFFLRSFWWPQRLFEKHFVWRFSGKYSQKQSSADVLKNFANVTGKHLFWSLLSIKLQAWRLRACDFIKKGLQHRCSPAKFAKFLRTPFLTEQLQWQLLYPQRRAFFTVSTTESFLQTHNLATCKFSETALCQYCFTGISCKILDRFSQET